MQNPNLYIIAGPNGAGKTTASFTLLPEVLHCPNFVNADEIARVAQRVSNGGHNIPESDIRRRFRRGIYNLINLYMPICDSVLLYNNEHTPARLVARKKNQVDKVELIETEMWNQLLLSI
jgi:predicted ABC-type ATPase